MKPWVIALIVVLTAIGVTVLLWSGFEIVDELRLPFLAVVAIVSVLLALAFVAAVFQKAGLHDTKHALALPEGSIRAMIALSLIVVFTVITLFVLARFSRSDVQCAECKELIAVLDERQKFLAKQNAVPAAANTSAITDTSVMTATSATTDTSVTAVTNTSATSSEGPPKPTIPRKEGAQQTTTPVPVPDPIVAAVAKRMEAGQDLAKQLLTMLGTLLAAVSSFYFGASSTAAASDPKKMAEAARAVDQIRGKIGG
jgi:amino acid transporter